MSGEGGLLHAGHPVHRHGEAGVGSDGVVLPHRRPALQQKVDLRRNGDITGVGQQQVGVEFAGRIALREVPVTRELRGADGIRAVRFPVVGEVHGPLGHDGLQSVHVNGEGGLLYPGHPVHRYAEAGSGEPDRSSAAPSPRPPAGSRPASRRRRHRGWPAAARSRSRRPYNPPRSTSRWRAGSRRWYCGSRSPPVVTKMHK